MLMGKDTEAELWRGWRATRSVAVRNELIVRYLDLVDQVAARLQARIPPYVDVGDLKSAGVFGLAAAIDGFEPARGVKFRTYAPRRIGGAMLDYIRDVDWVPRLVRKRREPVVGMVSLSAKVYEGDSRADVRQVDMIADASVPSPHIRHARREMIEELTLGMDRHERFAFVCYWFEDITMKEIGRSIGLSESRVSQLMTRLLSRVQRRFGRDELAELLDVA